MRTNLRTRLIRLAHANPSLRPHLLPLLASARTGTEFATQEALADYLKEHPDADKSKHSVKEQGHIKDTEHALTKNMKGKVKITHDDAAKASKGHQKGVEYHREKKNQHAEKAQEHQDKADEADSPEVKKKHQDKADKHAEAKELHEHAQSVHELAKQNHDHIVKHFDDDEGGDKDDEHHRETRDSTDDAHEQSHAADKASASASA